LLSFAPASGAATATFQYQGAAVDWKSVDLDRNSPVPLYYQLVEFIREAIRAGQLAPQAQLPPERQLAERLRISRMTARQAISLLARDGSLVVRHGIGVFVADPKFAYDAVQIVGFTEATMRRGSRVFSRVMEQRVTEPPESVARALGLRDQDETIKIVRVRSADGAPLALETSYLPARCCPGLVDEDLETQSLYSLLKNRYRVPLLRSSQTVEATVADEYEAGLFGIAAGVPLLLIEGITYSVNHQPVERFKSLYRADRARLTLESDRDEPGNADVPAARFRVVVGPR
jgi:GntR family transcriptional regulator